MPASPRCPTPGTVLPFALRLDTQIHNPAAARPANNSFHTLTESSMSDQPFIDRLMADISRRLPADLGLLRSEVERNVRSVLAETVSRLDLITREEFDIQQQVLLRTREKLEALEKQVAELEQK